MSDQDPEADDGPESDSDDTNGEAQPAASRTTPDGGWTDGLHKNSDPPGGST